jgi:hypothetical protein
LYDLTFSKKSCFHYRAKTIQSNTPFSFGELPDVKRLFINIPEDEEAEGSAHMRSIGNDYDDCDDDLSNESG